jgi:nicotinamide phosphoribosyltransferase
MFKVNALFRTDGYKVGHKRMLAPNTTRLYGTWIPRTLKYAPTGVIKVVSFGQEMSWQWIHDEFEENFFNLPREEAVDAVAKDLSVYLGLPYDATHFGELYDLGYLPMEVRALPEGIETPANIPHMDFINTVDGFAWLTLYLETIVSSLAWKPSTSATIALQYRRNTTEWVMKTDPEQAFLIDYMNHDFSARGLSPWDMVSSGLGHATSHLGSDTVSVIPAVRYFYNEDKNFVAIASVNASEHSVTTTEIFTVGEKQMIIDWLTRIPEGIFSMVCDTFSTWQFIEYLKDPEIKELVINRKGKLVVRPDSGDPVDIICGLNSKSNTEEYLRNKLDTNEKISEYTGQSLDSVKGVIELLADIFGYTTNEQGYKVLPPYIGAIYGDSINLERQVQIYSRLADKGFAATNIILGVGSFTYQFNTRDTFGFAAKGAWFEVRELEDYSYSNKSNGSPIYTKKGYNIYKDPVTDDGSKKSLKGFQFVKLNANGEYESVPEVTEQVHGADINLLQVIYRDGTFPRKTKFSEIRNRLKQL